MTYTIKQSYLYSFRKIIMTVLFAALFFYVFTIKSECSSQILSKNTSGNINYDPAVDPIENSDEYSAVLYNINNGLPISEVNAIAQTSEGFFWVGTYAGLLRYDGNTFEQPDITSSISNVRCLYFDQSKRLWIGTNDSGVYMLDGHDLKEWNRSNGMTSLSVRSITEDKSGNIYVAGTDGIGIIDHSLTYRRLTDERLAGQTITEVRARTDGTVYCVSSTGDIYVLYLEDLFDVIKSESYPFGVVYSILPDPENFNRIYIGTENAIYHGDLLDPSSFEVTDIAPLSGIDSLEYIGGKIWICSRSGLGRIEGKQIVLLENIPMNNSFCQIMPDQEGNLWIVSARQGLMKIVPNCFSNIFAKYGLDPTVVNTTCISGNSLFIGTEEGLIVIRDGVIVKRLPLLNAHTASGDPIDATDLIDYLRASRIRSIIRDSKGALWISTSRYYGLLKYYRGELTQFTQRDGLACDPVRVVSECSDGRMLVATNDGINIIMNDSVIRSYGKKDGLNVRLILSIENGFNNVIIAGSDGGGLYIIDNNNIKILGIDDGLKSEIILRVRKSTKRKLYWIIASNSVAYMTPDYKITTIQDFPYSNNYDVIENDNGDLWVLGSSGIYVLTAKDIEDGGATSPIFFGISNGLPFVSSSNSYSAMTDAGDLYISGNGGVIKININDPPMVFSTIRTLLPFIDADGEHIYPDSGGTFVIPGGTRKITIHPYVINFSLADPEITYRLKGFDPADIYTKRSELGSLTYTNLLSGNYEFTMSVANRLANTDTEASFKIVKGRQIRYQSAASIIIDITSIFLLIGILPYAAIRKRRRRIDDRLYFVIVGATITLAAADAISYFVENVSFMSARFLLLFVNTLIYGLFVLLPYLFCLYLYLRYNNYRSFPRKRAFTLAVPCLIHFIFTLLNIRTGWIFSITSKNNWKSGPYDTFIFVPVLFYLALSLWMIFKTNWRLMLTCMVIIAFHIVSDALFYGISFTSFMYTLFLICAHVNVMEKAVFEEEL